ncbi:MAG: DUF1648 domain-containing protein [Polaribacter sp.]|nr:DUF1648 domain-containing protein [Polaribacter sp.]MDG1811537.1 DUF1648 domain-containing protein [Polaribacter sp.]MDG1993267.1 DUF1648 domain-containing protein [Polaribacter sp.]
MNNQKNINFSLVDYILIAVSVLLIAISWIYLIIYYDKLPDQIATHFNAFGKPDGFNSRYSIWLAITCFTLLSLGFILGTKYQEAIIFPKRKLSLQEKESNLKTMLFTAILIAFICPLIVYSMIQGTLVEDFKIPWITPLIISVVVMYLIAVFYYQFKILKS